MPTKCFLLVPTNISRLYLRRYVSGVACSGELSYHNAKVSIADVQHSEDDRPDSGDLHDHQDPRWPKTCSCGYVFKSEDSWQRFVSEVYMREDTGEMIALDDAPPGAMWYCDWMNRGGPDGRCLAVKLPNGCEWIIDSRAQNCTMPNDKTHRCWVRHGEPPNVTVDKNGDTCAAGAGSIGMTNSKGVHYHGFLKNGILT